MKTRITVHQTQYLMKPNDSQCSNIRKIEENQVVEATTYQLASYVTQGQTFYLGVHDLSGANGNTTCEQTFISQSTFALDLDHGNFTLEQIQERLSLMPFKPNLIYPSFSHQEPHHRRWHIVWFSQHSYTDKEDIRIIQEYLMYVMGHDFREYGYDWVRHLDTSAKDVARLLFGGNKVSFLDDFASADFGYVFDEELQSKVKFFLNDLSNAKKELKRLENPSEGNTITKTQEKALIEALNASEPHIIPEANDPKALAEKMIKQLELLSMVLPDKPYSVDYYDRYEFINQLPLHMLLNVEIQQKFNCILPHHIDIEPSAHLILSNDGKNQQVYRCFGCMEHHHGYRTFNVLAIIFEAAFGLTLKQSLEAIYELLKIKIGSEYQRQAHAQIESDIAFLEQLGKDHPLNKKLKAKQMKTFYKAFLMLGKQKVSYECMLKEDQEKALVFFAANSFIQAYIKEEWIDDKKVVLNISSVNRKINYLVRLGLIDKIEYKDLTPMMRAKMEKFIEQTKSREQAVRQTPYRRNPDYYRINYLTPSLIDQAVQIIELEKKVVARSQGQGAKQTKASHGTEKSQTIYRQSKMTYSKEEERFLVFARKVIPSLFETKSFFTESELITKIDSKGKYWKRAQKEYLSQKLFPALVLEFQLEKRRVNKALRAQFKVPDKLTSNHHIVFKTADLI